MSLHMQIYDMIHPLRMSYYYSANLVILNAFSDTGLSLIDKIHTVGLLRFHARFHKCVKIFIPWTSTAAEEQTSYHTF